MRDEKSERPEPPKTTSEAADERADDERAVVTETKPLPPVGDVQE